MGAATGGDAVSGAVGGAVGELTGELYLASRIKKGLKKEDLPALTKAGVNYAKLAAGLSAALIGGDVDTAAST